MDPSAAAPGVVQVQPIPASTQRAAGVSSSASSSEQGSRGILPALEHLQRISHGGHHHQRNASSSSASVLPPLSSRGPFPTDGGHTPGPSAPPHQHLYQRHPGIHQAAAPVTSRPPVHPSLTTTSTISSISQQQHAPPVLPTYRQANSISGDGRDSRPPSSPSGTLPGSPTMDPSLPDLLHSHMVPPQVPPARPNQHRHQRRGARGSGGDGGNGPRRHHRRSHGGSRQHRRSRTTSGGSTTTATAGEAGSGMCKEPCVRCVVTVTSFRWVLVVLSILGVCCVVTGVVLAALRAAGNSFLFLAIMFIGLGILLVIVVAVGWKCTPRGHEPLHALFGIGNFRHGRSGGQTRERRRRRHRNRDSNWYGGVLYPEFQYRRPPPSYAASMQDYQNQQLQQGAGDTTRRNSSQQGGVPPSGAAEDRSLPNSPPPSYRSRASTAHSGIHIAFPTTSSSNAGGSGNLDGETPASRPPTYRSRAPSRRPSLPRNEVTGDGDIAFTGQAYPGVVVGSNSSDQNVSSSNIRSVGEDAAGLMTMATATTTTAIPTCSASATSASLTSTPSHGATSSSSTSHSPGSVTLQVYTLPTVRADNQNSSLLSSSSSSQFQESVSNTASTSGARNSAADHRSLGHQDNAAAAAALASTPGAAPSSQTAAVTGSTSSHQHSTPSQPPPRLPSLHQRMESSDRRMLEDALQSLEEHISEAEGSGTGGGIVNPAASFEPEVPSENFNTHL